MKRLTRKLLPALLAVACLLCAALPAFAYEENTDIAEERIEPRYEGLANMFSSMSINTEGEAYCTGTAGIRAGYTADVTVELQWSRDREHWYFVADWDASGTGRVIASGSVVVPAGYYYRAYTVANVYTDSGVFVEDCEKYSAYIEY